MRTLHSVIYLLLLFTLFFYFYAEEELFSLIYSLGTFHPLIYFLLIVPEGNAPHLSLPCSHTLAASSHACSLLSATPLTLPYLTLPLAPLLTTHSSRRSSGGERGRRESQRVRGREGVEEGAALSEGNPIANTVNTAPCPCIWQANLT